ncbi:MAG TPA: glycosyltransferase, partial [Gemmatimonadaceae bacterium]|nr:glycosyltransferase [Gemmatimonadaceae bacterium]
FVAHSVPRVAGDLAGAFILRLAVALRHHGVQVDVLAPAAAGVPASADIDGVPVRRFRYAPASWETLAYSGTMAEQARGSLRGMVALGGLVAGGRRAIARAMVTDAYDVVHAHWWFPGGLSAALSARARPLVVTLHGSDVRLARSGVVGPAMYRFVARRAAAVTAVSSWLANTATAFAPGVPVSVAPMPADIALFGPGAGTRAPRMLFVGRLNAQKGIRDLVEALPHVHGVALDVVGDGPDRAAVEQLAAARGVSGRIRWHGALPQTAVAPLYREAALVAVPSREEGLGLVAVEALLSGTPVVAYRSGGLTDLITHEETGLLVEPGDVDAFGNALVALVSDPLRARRMGEQGRSRMVARFSPAAAAEAYASLYRRVGTG